LNILLSAGAWVLCHLDRAHLFLATSFFISIGIFTFMFLLISGFCWQLFGVDSLAAQTS
jgi:hypothetical protein